jgi:hypothetical protein
MAYFLVVKIHENSNHKFSGYLIFTQSQMHKGEFSIQRYQPTIQPQWRIAPVKDKTSYLGHSVEDVSSIRISGSYLNLELQILSDTVRYLELTRPSAQHVLCMASDMHMASVCSAQRTKNTHFRVHVVYEHVYCVYFFTARNCTACSGYRTIYFRKHNLLQLSQFTSQVC